MLGTVAKREEIDITYPWLNECNKKGASKEIQTKCKISEALRTLGVGTLDGIKWVEQSETLPNFIYLNPYLVGFIIYLVIRYQIFLDIKTGKIYFINDDDQKVNFPNFFEFPELFDPINGKFAKLLIYRKPGIMKEYKMSVYRYLRIWFSVIRTI